MKKADPGRGRGASIDKGFETSSPQACCGHSAGTKSEQNEGFRPCRSPLRDTLSTPVESRVERVEIPAKPPFFANRHSPEGPIVGRQTRCYARLSLSSRRSWAPRVEQPIELTAETLWTEVSGRLKGALNDSTYRTWFGEVEGHEVSDEVFVLAVPNDFTREWIEGHFLELIRAAVRDATGQQRRIQLTVAETGAGVPDVTQPLAQRISESGLNTKYTFDLFVIGSSNRFRARGRARSRRGAGAGLQPALHLRLDRLGKTHLLQAIAQYVMEHPGTCR